MVSLIPTSEDTRIYEIAVLYPYPIAQKEESDLLKAIEEIFAEVGGKQLAKDPWGQRGLAYKIGGFTEGTFVIYYYDMDPSKLKEVDKALRILKGVLRHMIVKPPKHYQYASYAERYVQWQESERLEGQRREQEREEKLKQKVVEKAKRATKPVKEKKPEEVAKPMTEESINKELEKLISDTDLQL